MGRIEIIEDYIEYSKFTRTCDPIKSVKAVVIHYTGNPGSTAKANRNYFEIVGQTGDTYASCHYIVDLDGSVIAVIPEREKAYHAGGRSYTQLAHDLFYDKDLKRIYPHDKCIGIEVCHPYVNGKFNPETYTSLVALTADIVMRYMLKDTEILRHHDITGKNCPAWYVQHPYEWDKFKRDVMANVMAWEGVG